MKRSDDINDYRVELGELSLREPFLPVLVLGPPRTGKTLLVASPILQRWPGPSIVTSVRNDILLHTVETRSSRGKVYLFDPASIVQSVPRDVEVVGFNPVQFAEPWDEAVRMSEAIKDAGAATTGLQDAGFWFEMAAQLLAPLLFAAARSGYTMGDVRRWVKTQDDFEVRALLQAAGDEAAIVAFEAAINREERARSSIFTTLEACLGAYNTDEAVRLASKNPISPAKFFDESGTAPTLFLCAPPAAQGEYRAIFITMVRYFVDFVYARNVMTPPVWDDGGFKEWIRPAGEARVLDATASKSNIPLLLLLDEAGNVASLRSFETLVSTSAGSGIQLVSVFHDLSQLATLYGESRAMTAFNNHSAIVILPGMRDEKIAGIITAEAERLPQKDRASIASFRTIERGQALVLNENQFPKIVELRRGGFSNPNVER